MFKNKRGTDVMVDLETLSTAQNALILSIGAVKLDRERDKIVDEFYINVDIEQQRCFRDLNVDTLKFWIGQDSKASEKLFKDEVILYKALIEFSKFFNKAQKKGDDVLLWGNGATFDITILENAYTCLNINTPWKFYQHRCYRTLKSLKPEILLHREGVLHNALDDARSQGKHLLELLK